MFLWYRPTATGGLGGLRPPEHFSHFHFQKVAKTIKIWPHSAWSLCQHIILKALWHHNECSKLDETAGYHVWHSLSHILWQNSTSQLSHSAYDIDMYQVTLLMPRTVHLSHASAWEAGDCKKDVTHESQEMSKKQKSNHRTSSIRTAGQEALYARFWILPLEGVDDTKGESLGIWWGWSLRVIMALRATES